MEKILKILDERINKHKNALEQSDIMMKHFVNNYLDEEDINLTVIRFILARKKLIAVIKELENVVQILKEEDK